MSRTRYAVIGLARPRAAWFTEVSRWAAAGVVPVDFIRCVGAEEVRARLGGGRPLSALVIDGGLPALDRDLVDIARAAGCATIVVGNAERDWHALGVAAVIPPAFSREDLLLALESHATGLADTTRFPGEPEPDTATMDLASAWRGQMLAVTGPGGTGASLVAMALAQQLADDPRVTGHVLLADFKLRGELAMLHASPDVVPGVSELVEAHRAGRPDGRAVRSLTFDVPDRGYQLLLGLRRYRELGSVPYPVRRSCRRQPDVDLPPPGGGHRPRKRRRSSRPARPSSKTAMLWPAPPCAAQRR